MSRRTAFERLIEKYANGKPICNCGKAYYSPCGRGTDATGALRHDMLACEYGCSSNLISAKEYIAECVEKEILEDFK